MSERTGRIELTIFLDHERGSDANPGDQGSMPVRSSVRALEIARHRIEAINRTDNPPDCVAVRFVGIGGFMLTPDKWTAAYDELTKLAVGNQEISWSFLTRPRPPEASAAPSEERPRSFKGRRITLGRQHTLVITEHDEVLVDWKPVPIDEDTVEAIRAALESAFADVERRLQGLEAQEKFLPKVQEVVGKQAWEATLALRRLEKKIGLLLTAPKKPTDAKERGRKKEKRP